LAVGGLLLGGTPLAGRQEGASRAGRRREDAALERALRERGLTELLEHHLQIAGGGDEVSLRLQRRELFLAAYGDATRSTDDRIAHLRRATAELERLLSLVPDHAQASEWKMQLATDLLFKQAEPHYNNVLFRGGAEADYAALGELAARAEPILAALSRLMEGLPARLEVMTAEEYAVFQRSGRLELAERVAPQAEYFLRWAWYYRILAARGRQIGRPLKPEEKDALGRIIEYLVNQSRFTELAHPETGVQCQSLLLVGLCRRLLGEYGAAEEALGRCLIAAEGLAPRQRSAEVDWSVSVARLEQIRVAADAGRYDAAHQAAGTLLDQIRGGEPGNLTLLLSVVLLDRHVYLQQLRRLSSPQSPEAARLKELACEPVLALVRRDPTYERAVFGAVYEQMDRDSDASQWDSVEKFAFLSSVVEEGLRGAARPNGGGGGRVSSPWVPQAVRAAQAGELMLQAQDTAARELAPVCLFNLGLLHHLRGDELAAARYFVRTVREHPRFGRAELAAEHAVKITAALYQDPQTRSAAGVRAAFIEAVQALVDRFSQTEGGRYWRFFLAGALEEARRYEEAAAEYARVDRQHERFFEARYRHLWCSWRAYLEEAGPAAPDAKLLPKRAFAVAEAARQCVEDLQREQPAVSDAQRAEELTGWIAAARLIEAEMRLRPDMQQYAEALRMVAGFEERYASRPDLVVRALRIRLVAYQRMGELDKALSVVSEYVSRDPANAGVFLQELLTSLREEVEQLRKRGLDREADQRTQAALELARQLDAWADKQGERFSPANRTAVRLQLADVSLMAGRFEEALALYEQAAAELNRQASGDRESSGNANVLFGKAEALFRLGRFQEANSLFNELWRGLPERSPLWWRSGVRILGCGTELGADARTLLRFVQQHRRLDPDFGSPENRAEFEALEKRNQRRIQGDG